MPLVVVSGADSGSDLLGGGIWLIVVGITHGFRSRQTVKAADSSASLHNPSRCRNLIVLICP